MIVAIPVLTPVTFPDPSIVALPLLLLHVPPAVASVRLVTEPVHTVDAPAILAGNGFIETVMLPCVPQQPAADCALK